MAGDDTSKRNPDDVSLSNVGCGDEPCPPPIDFVTFITSLSAAALLHMGVMPDPDTNQPNPNLPLARQTIDLVQMLREKTLGNLTDEEQHLIDGILYDLKMRYVKAAG